MKIVNYMRVIVVSFIFGLAFTGNSHACALAFLPWDDDGVAVAIDGHIIASEWSDAAVATSGDACLDTLTDLGAHSLPVVYTAAASDQRNVKIYTKRDYANFYIAMDIEDRTLPRPSTVGEQIVINIDPNNNRGSRPEGIVAAPVDGTRTSYDYRYSVNFMRGASTAPATSSWKRGNGTEWQDDLIIPAGVIALASNLTGNTGYHVEIQIPYAAIGFGEDDGSGDLGMAIAIVNDMNAIESATFPVPVYSGLGYPFDNTNLPINISNDPIDSALTTSHWNMPSYWGEAYTSGAGDTMYFSQSPASWLSEDLVTAFCNAANFQSVMTAGGRVTTNPYWYKYKSTGTCNPMRVWAKLRRKGRVGEPFIGAQQRRTLFVWAEPNVSTGGVSWYYLKLSDPVTIDTTSPGGTETDGTPYKYKISPAIDWNLVEPGLPGHPCLRAIAMPVAIDPADKLIFDGYDAEDPPVRHIVDIAALTSKYVVTANKNQAQMNIMVLDTAVCPTAAQCVTPTASSMLRTDRVASADMSGIQLAQHTNDAQAHEVTIPGEQQDSNNAVFNLTGYGVAINTGGKRYTYVEKLGGQQVIVTPAYVKQNKDINVAIDFVNNKDGLARKAYVNVEQINPTGETTAHLDIKMPSGVLKPGEKVVLNTVVKEGPEPTSPGTGGPTRCGCFDLLCHIAKITD